MSKLQRSKNRIIFGVCGGISKLIGIEVAIVRILFILGTIFSGSILLWIYLILALVIPNED